MSINKKQEVYEVFGTHEDHFGLQKVIWSRIAQAFKKQTSPNKQKIAGKAKTLSLNVQSVTDYAFAQELSDAVDGNDPAVTEKLRRLEEFILELPRTKVDITGLMVKAKLGWEERAERLCKAEKFFVAVDVLPSLMMELTDDELVRLNLKLKLVEEFAGYMAAGMLKGTIKYEKDDYSLDQWMAHLIGEGADQANYSVLLFNAFRDERAECALVQCFSGGENK